MQVRNIRVALVGNPNSGKSTVFNQLTGLNQKIANFPGVTVEKRSGFCQIGKAGEPGHTVAEIIDLPGTYSLYPKTLEEQVPFQVLCDPSNPSHPDVVIIVADGTNLKRSLFLCSQIVDLKIPSILVVNMMDQVRKRSITIDFDKLSHGLGIKVIPMNALGGEGVMELKKALAIELPVPATDFIDASGIAPEVVGAIRQQVRLNSSYAAFQVANNLEAIGYFKSHTHKLEKIRAALKENDFDPSRMQAVETLERYKEITELLRDITFTPAAGQEGYYRGFTKRIDNILLHKVWGYLIFLVVMFLLFQAVFAWAAYPMELVDTAFAWISGMVHDLLPKGILNDLLVEGVLAGLGGVVIFIPQIALLFMFIAILEDTGYMTRVSFMMDKMLRRFGLNGRSVIPLISGVACAVPAIMSTRTIKSWKERLITIFVTPLMSCSARLPVYTLLIALVVPQHNYGGFINQQGLVLMALYLIGFVAALGSALVLKWIIRSRERDYFIMEIPVYRMPRWKNIGLAIFEKIRIFVFDAGKVIVAISVVLWVLSSTGPGDSFRKVNTALQENEQLDKTEVNKLMAEKLRLSYAGVIGRAMEPAIAPLGFDWKIGIALITSFAAREVFVGTMSTIYSVGSTEANTATVREKMMAEINPDTGLPRYNLAVGWSLMLFYAFAMQCMSTLAVVRRETGSWKWPLFQFAFMGVLAYISSFLVYRFLS
ncbi:MAG TPA: ferrous iron transport protein B [Bacteroidia bacterium]|nr:ferrous iron transport protein B [Bacteroidia bacterium]